MGRSQRNTIFSPTLLPPSSGLTASFSHSGRWSCGAFCGAALTLPASAPIRDSAIGHYVHLSEKLTAQTLQTSISLQASEENLLDTCKNLPVQQILLHVLVRTTRWHNHSNIKRAVILYIQLISLVYGFHWNTGVAMWPETTQCWVINSLCKMELLLK